MMTIVRDKYRSVLLFCAMMGIGSLLGCNMETYDHVPMEVIYDYESPMSPYMVFDVRADNIRITVAVRNAVIYSEYRDQLNMDSDNYADQMRSYIVSQEPIEISHVAMRDLMPYSVWYDERVDSVGVGGSDALLEYYFDNQGIIKRDLKWIEERYLIKRLFKEGVFTTKTHFAPMLSLYPISGIGTPDRSSDLDTLVPPDLPPLPDF